MEDLNFPTFKIRIRCLYILLGIMMVDFLARRYDTRIDAVQTLILFSSSWQDLAPPFAVEKQKQIAAAQHGLGLAVKMIQGVAL